MVGRFVGHYNHVRLHSALGYITPADRLAGRQDGIHAERDRKLAEARRCRALRRRDPTPEGDARTSTAEEASRGVQRGGNEHPLVCVNAIDNRGEAAPIPNPAPNK
jgi:hypothetical protein